MSELNASAAKRLVSPKVAELVFGFAEGALGKTSLKELDNHLEQVLSVFDIKNFILVQAFDRRRRARAELVCGRSHAPWRAHYLDCEAAGDDDVLRAGLETQEPITWSAFKASSKIRPKQKQIFNEASEFDLKDGALFPIHELDGSLSTVSMFIPETLHHDARSMAALHMLAIYYAIAVRRIRGDLRPAERRPTRPLLTPRQRECLQWIRAGKSDWEISMILGISQHTVIEHVEQARKRLGVKTRTQAVIEAIAMGLIHL